MFANPNDPRRNVRASIDGSRDKSFDKSGSYSMGLTEQAVWPEINMTNVTFTHGMHINIVFVNSTPEMSRFVLTELGMPFVRREGDPVAGASA